MSDQTMIPGRRLRDTREPMDYQTAVEVMRVESEHQKEAESQLAKHHRSLADAEKRYREAVAKRIIEKRAEKHAANLCKELARGDSDIAQLGYERDLAIGMVDAAQQSIWRHTANRRDLEHFIDWSKRASFLDMEGRSEGHGGHGSGR